jgi:hypothetical protein
MFCHPATAVVFLTDARSRFPCRTADSKRSSQTQVSMRVSNAVFHDPEDMSDKPFEIIAGDLKFQKEIDHEP